MSAPVLPVHIAGHARRIGTLAVVLGVGFALGNCPPIAWAVPDSRAGQPHAAPDNTIGSTPCDSAPTELKATPEAPLQQTIRVTVIGDSYTGGSGEGGNGAAGWASLSRDRLQALGIDLTENVSGEGGSGYVHRGTTGTIFGEEAARLVSADDNVIVFFGSSNDSSSPIGDVASAAASAFAAAKLTAPSATLIVIGPAWPNAAPSYQVLQIRDTLNSAALQAGAIFVDPIAEGWFFDQPQLIGTDGVHPTDAGHVYMADRIEPRIAAAIGYPSGQPPLRVG